MNISLDKDHSCYYIQTNKSEISRFIFLFFAPYEPTVSDKA